MTNAFVVKVWQKCYQRYARIGGSDFSMDGRESKKENRTNVRM